MMEMKRSANDAGGVMRYTVADLFCGCGGFSHGFARSDRFDVVFGNDIKGPALRTFQNNHKGELGPPEVLRGDIREIALDDIRAALERKGVKDRELDCLIGGPPCQGFSQMRRSEERKGSKIVKFSGYNRLADDPRNDLVLRFLEIAEALRPKFLVIENVPQMLRHSYNGALGGLLENIRQILERGMRYRVVVDTINAADYGVPQLRERVFFLASRDGSITFPKPTHTDPEGQQSLFTISRAPWRTVADAIRDLPVPSLVKDELGGGALELYPRVELTEYAHKMRSSVAFPYNHVTRGYNAKIMDIIREMRPGETWDHASARMQERYSRLIMKNQKSSESADETKERLIQQGLINPTFYQSYYWSAYTRLAWDRPALTVTANANFLGSGRFTHPEADRGITMREAARLQSFDDDFRFFTSEGDDDTARIGVGMDMIGEAVPPLLAEALARHIASLLDEQRGKAHQTHAGARLQVDDSAKLSAQDCP